VVLKRSHPLESKKKGNSGMRMGGFTKFEKHPVNRASRKKGGKRQRPRIERKLLIRGRKKGPNLCFNGIGLLWGREGGENEDFVLSWWAREDFMEALSV